MPSSSMRFFTTAAVASVGALAGTAAAAASFNSAAACNVSLSALGADKVKTLGLEYLYAAKQGAWNVENQQQTPTCIVFPISSRDVSLVMSAVYTHDSNYSVRSGGHTAMKGWNTVENGVLIDLVNMNNASYDPISDSITVQPGARWGDVYTKLDKFGVSPVGGRQSDVGVGGFLTGGGFSYLSRAHGYGCDSYRSLDVVLPSGQLLTNVTADGEHSDLFRALKGGGSRFGIVTRFELDAIHVGTSQEKPYFGGNLLYPNTSVVQVLEAMEKFIATNDDPNTIALLSVSYLSTFGVLTPLILANIFYRGTKDQFYEAFRDFIDCPLQNITVGPASYSDITKALPAGSERTWTSRYGASAVYPDLKNSSLVSAYSHFMNFTYAFRTEAFLYTLGVTPISPTQVRVSQARGGAAFSSNLENEGRGYAALQLGKAHMGLKIFSPEYEAGIQLLNEQIVPSDGLPLYLNESDERQDTFRSYSWFEQLKTVYAKYDPIGFSVRRMQGPIGLS